MPKRIRGQRKARLLFWTSLWLCLPALTGAFVIAVISQAHRHAPLFALTQIFCWTAIVADISAWLATLVMLMVEKPQDFEIMVDNPDYDPNNLY